MNAAIRAVFLSAFLAGLISCSDNAVDPSTPGEPDRSSDADASIVAADEADADVGVNGPGIANDPVADSSDDATATGGTDEGASADEPVSDPDAAYVGIVVVADTKIEAEFFEYPSSDATDAPANLSAMASRVCLSSERVEIASMQVESAVVPRSIDAGEVIVLTGQHGTFVELLRQLSEDHVRYTSRIDLDRIGDIPTRLVVDIPGQEFPSFPQIEVPIPSSDASGSNAAPDASATASSTAYSDNDTNPDGQETMDSDASVTVSSDDSGDSVSVSVQQVSCATTPAVDNARMVDRVATVIVKKVQHGKAMLLVFRLLS